jgi:hypothetical protein
VAESACLESTCAGNGTVGSNPTLSAMFWRDLLPVINRRAMARQTDQAATATIAIPGWRVARPQSKLFWRDLLPVINRRAVTRQTDQRVTPDEHRKWCRGVRLWKMVAPRDTFYGGRRHCRLVDLARHCPMV